MQSFLGEIQNSPAPAGEHERGGRSTGVGTTTRVGQFTYTSAFGQLTHDHVHKWRFLTFWGKKNLNSASTRHAGAPSKRSGLRGGCGVHSSPHQASSSNAQIVSWSPKDCESQSFGLRTQWSPQPSELRRGSGGQTHIRMLEQCLCMHMQVLACESGYAG